MSSSLPHARPEVRSAAEIRLTVRTGLGMKRAYPLGSNHALFQLFHYYSLWPGWINLVGLCGRQKRNVTGKQRMLDQEDMKWLAATATALNGFLQKATRQVEMARLCKSEDENLDSLNEQIELASRASQAIFDRITTRILARAAGVVGPGEATQPRQRPLSARVFPRRFRLAKSRPPPTPQAMLSFSILKASASSFSWSMTTRTSSSLPGRFSISKTTASSWRKMESKHCKSIGRWAGKSTSSSSISFSRSWMATRSSTNCARSTQTSTWSSEQRLCRAKQTRRDARPGAARFHSKTVHPRKTARTSALHARRATPSDALVVARRHGATRPRLPVNDRDVASI